MSNYYDFYDEKIENIINKQLRLENYKKRLINELPIEDMIKILFKSSLSNKGEWELAQLVDEYLDKKGK